MSNDTTPTIDPTDAIAAAVENKEAEETKVKEEEVVVVPEETANTQAPSTSTPKKDRPRIITEATKPQVTKTPVATVKEEPIMTIPQKYMKDYIDRYLSINDGLLDSEAKKKQAIDAFKKLCYHAINNASDMSILDMVLDLFKKQRNRILSEELALQGLQHSDKSDQMKISVFYRMFYDYSNPARKKKATVNMDQVRSIFGNDHVVNYLVRKFPK